MSFILSIIFYWIQQGKLAILILSIKKNIPSGPYYLVMLCLQCIVMNCFPSGPEAFTGMALYPASAWKIPYSAARPLCLHMYLAFPLLSFLASHNFHLAQGSSFSCITAPVAVHTAVSLYSWSHANINALPRNDRYSLPDSTGILTSYCWLLMADNNIDDRVLLLPCLWCLRSSPSSIKNNSYPFVAFTVLMNAIGSTGKSRVRPLLFTFCFTLLLSLPSIPFLHSHNF